MFKIASMIPDQDPVEIGNLDYLNFYLDRVFPEAMAQEVQTGAHNTTLQFELSCADNLQFEYDLRHVSSKFLQYPDTIALRNLYSHFMFSENIYFSFCSNNLHHCCPHLPDILSQWRQLCLHHL